jgi:hypothetical protein
MKGKDRKGKGSLMDGERHTASCERKISKAALVSPSRAEDTCVPLVLGLERKA